MKFLTSKWPAILWSVIVFVALVISVQGMERDGIKLFPQSDKIIHFILFGVFTLLWLNYLNHKKPLNKSELLVVVAISSIYGIAMEFVQLLPIVSRDFSIGDMAADVAGSIAAAWWYKKKPR